MEIHYKKENSRSSVLSGSLTAPVFCPSQQKSDEDREENLTLDLSRRIEDKTGP